MTREMRRLASQLLWIALIVQQPQEDPDYDILLQIDFAINELQFILRDAKLPITDAASDKISI